MLLNNTKDALFNNEDEKNETKTIEVAFEEYIKYCTIKNLCEYTVVYYKNAMDLFSKFYDIKRVLIQFLEKL